jgi:hypothetical protein
VAEEGDVSVKRPVFVVTPVSGLETLVTATSVLLVRHPAEVELL